MAESSHSISLHPITERDAFLSYDSDSDLTDMKLDEEQPAPPKESHHIHPSHGPFWKCPSSRSNGKYLSRRRTRRALICCLSRRPCYLLLVIIGILTLFSLAWDGAFSFFAERREPDIFPGYHPSPFTSWFAHGVNPVPCHSHNDYWRRVPLYSALSAGCTSVEADVWLDGDELRVGHSRKTILQGQSLRSLYLHPLLEMLEHNNPFPVNTSTPGAYSNRAAHGNDPDPVGIFVNDPAQSLVLLIDFKTHAEEIWSLVNHQLEPLRERGFLTHFDGQKIIERPITIVGTGDTPFHRILESAPIRDIFYDAPLRKLTLAPQKASEAPNTIQSEADMFNAGNSYYASIDFGKSIGSLGLSRFKPEQLTRLRGQVQAAHARGLKVRYWGTPKWPVGLRNYVWRVLVSEGVDVLSVDDLYGATRQDWTRGWWR